MEKSKNSDWHFATKGKRLKSNNDQWMEPSDENLKGNVFSAKVLLTECPDPSYHHCC